MIPALYFSYFLLASTPDRTHSAASVTVIRQPVTEKLFIYYITAAWAK